MKIYGVALLAFCFLLGKLCGNALGAMIGLSNDVGGVGFAMIFLILSYSYARRHNMITKETESGILFWSSMYIPIVIAMASTLNVKAALSGGSTALLAGMTATIAGFALVPLISRIGKTEQKTR